MINFTQICLVKHFFCLLLLIAGTATTRAQKIDMVVVTGYGSKAVIHFVTRDRITLVLDTDGSITETGTDYGRNTLGYWPGRLNQYMGRTDYYPATENEAIRGKLRYIGLTLISWYGSYEEAASAGKVRSIGGIPVEYYPSFEDEAVKGKIKKIGNTVFSYYTSFDNESLRGKIRSIGNTSFDYYTSFDDKALRGKLKSLGNQPFTYYSSFENVQGRQGLMKSGFQTQYINGINFYVRN